MSDHNDSTTSDDTSSDSSSSDEEIIIKQKKKVNKNITGLCYFTTNKIPDGYCLMAKSSKDEKTNDSSGSENESELRTYNDLVVEVETLNFALDNHNKLIKDTKKHEPKVNPQPERMRFHCDHCGRDGHLAEFCYRRKRAERRERQWRNQDMYHPGHGVHGSKSFPPSRGAHREQGIR
ncbi:hypothetical protein C2845_PM12G12760 [Panicum miliaceum]|uniref:CCHC-type domain-containing protein n=1 Tax=Panicum miliaceum TaxID=4540 RepID=A0A3L6QCF5_PANMI|nr:hypothetical protein C2845_PM12G12760 [Panicum miliaceum]